MKITRTLFVLLAFAGLFLVTHCNGVQVQTAANNPLPTGGTPPSDTPPDSPPPPPKLGEVTPSAFLIGSDYPADIDIVDVPGLEETLFITTFFPAAVLAVDLNANPLKISESVKGLQVVPGGAGLPSSLFVLDAARAFLLTSTSVVYFNPTDGSVYETDSVTDPISLSGSLAQVDANGSALADVTGSFTPSFPAGIVAVGNKLVIAYSNLFYAGFSLDHAVQGIVRFFDINGTPPYLTPSATPYAALSEFNATGLTSLSNGKILATNTGITKFTPDFSNQEPVTAGAVGLIDPSTGTLEESLDLGMTAPAFRSWAVLPDGSKAFIGSASGGYLLEIGLNPLTLLRGGANPIVVTNATNGTDYIDDVALSRKGGGLYPMSFNNSKVYAVDLTGAEPTLLPDVVDLAFPGGVGVTGAGPGALRPGEPGVDFTTPDLFVLTSNPGTVAAIKTY